MHRAARLAAIALLAAGCDTSTGRNGNHGPGNGTDLGVNNGADQGAPNGDGGAIMSCMDGPDLTGCSCSAGATRSCYPSSADPATRNVGACKDGSQMCAPTGEFPSWGTCGGAITPVTENCTDGIDNNCDGKIDCADATCATDPACKTGCTDGQTRPCYDGPSGTENVGTCKDGTQTCAGGMWPTNCPGETLPTTENCTDALDHNCNHLPGCLDLFACITSPACMQGCTNPLDNGCVCPQGSGDTATCPEGMLGVNKGGFPGSLECCPCTTNDCGNAACCGETVCAGNPQCSQYTCKPLPASCNGQVNADCDDFPEDCDEPCCKCTSCP
ncbi:MAG TPA: hypothetical protein VFF06_08595 [Polyangia bacterium]|nr:hypothetical protein [Polyangia bacterium]